MLEEKKMLSIGPKEAAKRYDLSVGTLANLRFQKRGPKYYRCGRKILYRVPDLEEYLFQNVILTIDSIKDRENS